MTDTSPWTATRAICEGATGCMGASVESAGTCVAHMSERRFTTHLGQIEESQSLDLQGTRIGADRFSRIMEALRGGRPTSAALWLRSVNLATASVDGDVDFTGARFAGPAWFVGATFRGRAVFHNVTFTRRAEFSVARFLAEASFNGTSFETGVALDQVWAPAGIRMTHTRFGGPNSLSAKRAQVGRYLSLWGATFAGDVDLGHACVQELILDDAAFEQPFRNELFASLVSCNGSRFTADATLAVHGGRIELDDVEVQGRLTVSRGQLSDVVREIVDQQRLAVPGDDASAMAQRHLMAGLMSRLAEAPRVVSLSGVDASKVSFFEVDLTECRFAGAHHLDQLHMESVRFARRGERYSARRRMLQEEQDWRSQYGVRRPSTILELGRSTPQGLPSLQPGRIAVLYRQLRKAQEDAKNEPGAADFYYGEMEMRRHDPDTPLGERFVLHLYWLFSGYGLRATRALLALAAVVVLFGLCLMLYGLPSKPSQERWTAARANKAVEISLGAVLFHDSGKQLTSPGRYTEMTAKVAGPVLWVLAALAVRNRIKR